jgi:hypothetical protein
MLVLGVEESSYITQWAGTLIVVLIATKLHAILLQTLLQVNVVQPISMATSEVNRIHK